MVTESMNNYLEEVKERVNDLLIETGSPQLAFTQYVLDEMCEKAKSGGDLSMLCGHKKRFQPKCAWRTLWIFDKSKWRNGLLVLHHIRASYQQRAICGTSR